MSHALPPLPLRATRSPRQPRAAVRRGGGSRPLRLATGQELKRVLRVTRGDTLTFSALGQNFELSSYIIFLTLE